MPEQWGVVMNPGTDYDPNSERAREARAKGLCGYCGHKAHWRLIGCEVCGPERCPILFELSPEGVERVAEIQRKSEAQ